MPKSPSGRLTDEEQEFHEELHDFLADHGDDVETQTKAYLVQEAATKVETGEL